MDKLYRGNGEGAGWRFCEDAYWWLTSLKAKPMPPAVAARPAGTDPTAPTAPASASDPWSVAADDDDDEEDPLAPPRT